MTISAWWDGDPAETYWMEITDRADLGGELWAPKVDASGAEAWSYTLVSYVQPGDRVFHWHKNSAGVPALIGWSEAAGPLRSDVRAWQARGAAGRARGVPITGPTWVMPLKGLQELPKPISRADLNGTLYEAVLAALHQTQEEVGERRPTYAPFQHYGGRELRAQQGYLTKMPAALVAVLFPDEGAPAGGDITVSGPRRSPGQGYLSDAQRRTAIEQHAVARARAHYEQLGATDIIELGKPYDLKLCLHGEERHIEVKGSSVPNVETVELTQGEVIHARSWRATDLVIVDGIECAMSADGVLKTTGGTLRSFTDWVPAEQALRSTHLRYTVPSTASFLDEVREATQATLGSMET